MISIGLGDFALINIYKFISNFITRAVIIVLWLRMVNYDAIQNVYVVIYHEYITTHYFVALCYFFDCKHLLTTLIPANQIITRTTSIQQPRAFEEQRISHAQDKLVRMRKVG